MLTPSGVTRLLDGLERDGWVRKGNCESDARVTYAVLTDEGRERLESAGRRTSHRSRRSSRNASRRRSWRHSSTCSAACPGSRARRELLALALRATTTAASAVAAVSRCRAGGRPAARMPRDRRRRRHPPARGAPGNRSGRARSRAAQAHRRRRRTRGEIVTVSTPSRSGAPTGGRRAGSCSSRGPSSAGRSSSTLSTSTIVAFATALCSLPDGSRVERLQRGRTTRQVLEAA